MKNNLPFCVFELYFQMLEKTKPYKNGLNFSLFQFPGNVLFDFCVF